ncbi:hypothetical protein B7486_75340, partial [cyanobacterium TDX16]
MVGGESTVLTADLHPPDAHLPPVWGGSVGRAYGHGVAGAPAIEVSGLRKSYGSREVLKGIDL